MRSTQAYQYVLLSRNIAKSELSSREEKTIQKRVKRSVKARGLYYIDTKDRLHDCSQLALNGK